MATIAYMVVYPIPSPGDSDDNFRRLLGFLLRDVGDNDHTFSRMNRGYLQYGDSDYQCMITFKKQEDYVRFKLMFGDDYKIRTVNK